MMTALWWDGESGRVAMAGPMYEGFPHVHVHAAPGVLLKPANFENLLAQDVFQKLTACL